MAGCQFAHDAGFDLYLFDIFFQLDFVTGFQFDMRIDAVAFEQMLGFFGNHRIERQRSGLYIRQAASFGFLVPFVAVAIAFKQYFFAA